MLHITIGATVVIGLLEVAASIHMRSIGGNRDLVMMHIPFNFGNTIAKNALLGHGHNMGPYGMAMMASRQGSEGWATLHGMAQADAEYWGPLNPDISVISETTGCNMYYTPQELWPQELVDSYFGNKTVFGVLRNPYDRLVSFFKGSGEMFYPEFFKTCDADGAVKKMMEEYLAGNRYEHNCQLVPQAEYFKGPRAVTVPLDVQTFPNSANDVFKAHGYTNALIDPEDELTVAGGKCNEMWGEDLSAETKALVKEVYAGDFELLCNNFGYCDSDKATCIVRSKGMCPDKAFVWDPEAAIYKARA